MLVTAIQITEATGIPIGLSRRWVQHLESPVPLRVDSQHIEEILNRIVRSHLELMDEDNTMAVGDYIRELSITPSVISDLLEFELLHAEVGEAGTVNRIRVQDMATYWKTARRKWRTWLEQRIEEDKELSIPIGEPK